MNGTDEHYAITDEFSIAFHFTDGEKFTQTLPISHADAAKEVIEWMENKKGSPVFKWQHPHSSKVQMVIRSQLTFIEIQGYIELEGKPSKWYQRIIDKIRTKWVTKKF